MADALVVVDLESVRGHLVSLALADHVGDVADTLPMICVSLGLPEPEWSDERHRMVFPWEAQDEGD